MHGALTAERARKLGDILSAGPETLYLDSGDAIASGNLDLRPWDRTVSRLNELGCAAMATGNREFHPWPTMCRRKTAGAEFPVLAGNVTISGSPVPWLPPSAILTTGSGLRVGVFGLTLALVKPGTWHEKLSRFRFENPIEAARRLACELRPQCDLLVALTHIGLDPDRELAQHVEGIHLILGGHSHDETDPLENIGGAIICHSGHHARRATRLEVSVSGAGGVQAVGDVVNLG